MPTTIPPAQHYPVTVGAQPILWLLTIDYGGDIVRLSTDALDVADAATGLTHHYTAGLAALRYTDRLSMPGDVSEGATVPVEALFPFDVAEREARGHRLEGARGELARWIVGTDYGDRRVVFVGQVTDPTFGADGEPVSFSVDATVWTEDVNVPAENQRVIRRNFGDNIDGLDEGEVGKYYPIIFGKPGRVNSGVLTREWVTGSRARRCDRERLAVVNANPDVLGMNGLRAVLAGHPVEATRVYVSTNAHPAGERFGVVQTTDDRGQVISVIDATPDGSVPTGSASPTDWQTTDPDGNPTYGLGRGSAAGTSTAADAAGTVIDASYQPGYTSIAGSEGRFDLFVGWHNDSQDGNGEGGMIGPDGQVIRGAGDVATWLLERTNKPIDYGRWAAAAPLLDQYKIDAVIDSPCQPWAWVRDHLLPILPMTITSGPAGIYPVVWRYNATTADAVFNFDADADPRIQRASPVTVDSSKIKNNFSLDYAYSIRTSSHWGNVRLGAGPYDSDDTDAHVSLYCKLSQHRYRYLNGQPRVVDHNIKTSVIYDSASAYAVLAWMARAYCLARRTVSYVVPEREWGWLERGMVGTLDHGEIHAAAWVVLVTDVQILDDGTLGIELTYLEDPVRDDLRFG